MNIEISVEIGESRYMHSGVHVERVIKIETELLLHDLGFEFGDLIDNMVRSAYSEFKDKLEKPEQEPEPKDNNNV